MAPAANFHDFLAPIRRLPSTSTSGASGSFGTHPLRLTMAPEGAELSRMLSWTYHLVILCLLLLFTALKWAPKGVRWASRAGTGVGLYKRLWAKQRDPFSKSRVEGIEENDTANVVPSASSSSSATLHDVHAFQDQLHSDEHTALLGGKAHTRRSRAGVGNLAKAWLINQPKPIPYIKLALPANGTTLAVGMLLGLNVFYTVYRIEFSIPGLFVFSDRASTFSIANLPLFYLLAARSEPLKILTGYSGRSLAILHRRLGEVVCLLATIHSACTLVGWYGILHQLHLPLGDFLWSRVTLLGFGALIAYEGTFFTSFGVLRRKAFTVFLSAQVGFQLAALILLCLHAKSSQIYVGIALGIMIIDLVVCQTRAWWKTLSLPAIAMVSEDGVTLGLSAPVNLKTSTGLAHRILGSNVEHGWRATQYVFLSVPALWRKHPIQSHALTIASKAPSAFDEDTSLDLVTQANDGFSRDLLDYAKEHSELSIRLTGPYGSDESLSMLQRSDVRVIVAGGRGILVTWPLVCMLLKELRATDDQDGSRPKATRPHVLFVWVVRNSSERESFRSVDLDELYDCGVEVMIPDATEQTGPPDLAGAIISWIDDKIECFTKDIRAGVICSGPDDMTRTVRNACAGILGKGVDTSLSIEESRG